jgi:hypothetical protein
MRTRRRSTSRISIAVSRRAGRSINYGNGEEGRGGEWLIRRWFATTVAFGDGPSPEVEGMILKTMTMAVTADAESARTLLVDVTTPELLAIGAGFSRHGSLP